MSVRWPAAPERRPTTSERWVTTSGRPLAGSCPAGTVTVSPPVTDAATTAGRHRRTGTTGRPGSSRRPSSSVTTPAGALRRAAVAAPIARRGLRIPTTGPALPTGNRPSVAARAEGALNGTNGRSGRPPQSRPRRPNVSSVPAARAGKRGLPAVRRPAPTSRPASRRRRHHRRPRARRRLSRRRARRRGHRRPPPHRGRPPKPLPPVPAAHPARDPGGRPAERRCAPPPRPRPAPHRRPEPIGGHGRDGLDHRRARSHGHRSHPPAVPGEAVTRNGPVTGAYAKR